MKEFIVTIKVKAPAGMSRFNKTWVAHVLDKAIAAGVADAEQTLKDCPESDTQGEAESLLMLKIGKAKAEAKTK